MARLVGHVSAAVVGVTLPVNEGDDKHEPKKEVKLVEQTKHGDSYIYMTSKCDTN